MRCIKVVFKKGNYDHEGDGREKVNDSLHDKVDLTAVVTFDSTVDGTNAKVNGCNDYRKQEGESCRNMR